MNKGRDPGEIELTLNKKALKFLVAALDAQLAGMNERLASGSLSEDEESEVGNDRDYLDGLRKHLAALADTRATSI